MNLNQSEVNLSSLHIRGVWVFTHEAFHLIVTFRTKARFRRRSTHVPNLIDELSPAKERRLNQTPISLQSRLLQYISFPFLVPQRYVLIRFAIRKPSRFKVFKGQDTILNLSKYSVIFSPLHHPPNISTP